MSIFDFLMPGMLGSYAHFRERFEMPVLSGDETAQKKLQSFVGPFILRRLKSQVLKDLPTRSRTSSQCSCRGSSASCMRHWSSSLRSVIREASVRPGISKHRAKSRFWRS